MIGIIAAGLAAVLAVAVAAALGYRRLRQWRVARQLTITTPDGIVEELFVHIGGIEQWMGIRGEDRGNPVLLVLHGGPGSPYSIFTPLLRSWERHFTVVQWDRRGVGKTLRRNGKAGSEPMTFEQLVDDGIEVVEFLRRHLGVDRVILMAGSMGTLVGIPMASRRPDLFSAYVGTDHYADMHRNEVVSYQLTLERAKAAGNGKATAALERIGADPSQWSVRAWNTKMAWTMRTDPVTPGLDTKLILPLTFTAPTYTLRDVFSFFTGFEFAKARLFDQFMSYDARACGTRFEIPFFVFQGESDVLTVTSLARDYFADVDAPVKELVLISDAGHFAAFSQPGQFLAALVRHVRPLAVPEHQGS